MADNASTPIFCIVLSEHLNNHYAGPLARGAASAAIACDSRLIFYSPLNIYLNRHELRLADLPLLPQHVHGYLLPGFITEELETYCRNTGAPILTYAGTQRNLPKIGPDNRAAACGAVAHLLAHGHRRIVHLMGHENSIEAQERFQGYCDALAQAGLPLDPQLVVRGHFRISESQIAIAALLDHQIEFDAIFAANDLSARGALLALKQAGRHVPADVALIGFDDSVGSDTLTPPLTTVRQSAFQIGWDAIVALYHGYTGTPLPDTVATSTRLVIRDSCGPHPLDTTRHPNWADDLAGRLGIGQGALVEQDAVASLFAALEDPDQPDWMEQFDTILRYTMARRWHVPALREYLAGWQNRVVARGLAPEQALQLVARAKDLIGKVQEEHYLWERQARDTRLNAITYTIDVLRLYNRDTSLEAMLRYIVSNGPVHALIAHRGTTDHSLIVQHVETGGTNHTWNGMLADFPPDAWLRPGEALLIMPLTTGQHHNLIGLVERDAQTYLDIDDLLLHSINTYRSVALLTETLRELEIARSVQQSLLPQSMPASDQYEIAGASRTARQMSGDLYGYYVRPDGALALAVGDMVGKGMPAALLMSACVTTLAGVIQAGLTPGRTLDQMHRVLQPYIRSGQNAAICLAYLDDAQVRIANAGAIAPLIRSGGEVRLLEIGGLPLGTPLSGERAYLEAHVHLAPGDLLVMSSDGIVEAMNEQGQIYGFERLLAALKHGPAESATAMLEYVLADMTIFAGEAEIRDDIAIVVVRYRG